MEENKYGNRYKKFDEKPLEIQLLPNRVKELRMATGKSAEAFAYDNDWSRSSYSRIERGEDVRYSTIIRLCRVHKLTPKQFFSHGFNGLPQQ